jgi:predicted transcriptional regulator
MPDTKTIDTSLVIQIVRSYVAHNNLSAAELPNLIATVHRSLAGLEAPAETSAREPAVAINRSYGRNFVACLDCGWRGQVLRRHLTTAHGLSPSDYKTRWKLKDTHPITAPDYSERRSTLAKHIGLGRHPTGSENAPEPAPRRRGRPRSAAPGPPVP